MNSNTILGEGNRSGDGKDYDEEADGEWLEGKGREIFNLILGTLAEFYDKCVKPPIHSDCTRVQEEANNRIRNTLNDWRKTTG